MSGLPFLAAPAAALLFVVALRALRVDLGMDRGPATTAAAPPGVGVPSS